MVKSPSSDKLADENSQEYTSVSDSPPETNVFDDYLSEDDYEDSEEDANHFSNKRRMLIPSVLNLPDEGSKTSLSSSNASIPISETVPEMDIVYPPGGSANNQIPKSVILSLLIMRQIRENILTLFGCLLQRPMDFLTEPQYTSLHILFIELRNRPSRIHSITKEIKTVPKSDLTKQLISIMKILGKNLPPYIGCAAKFWVQELEEERINFKLLPPNTCPSTFNILNKANTDLIKIQIYKKPIDAPTRMTEYVLGPTFVKILFDIQKVNVVLSQEIFGMILANFPLIPYDPILDENIRFILTVTLNAEIPSWQEIEMQSTPGEPYRFIKTVIAKILVLPNVPRQIKEALTYIRSHLKPVPITHINPDYSIMHQVNDKELNIEVLLSFIVPKVFSPEIICLKNRLLKYIQEDRLSQTWMLKESDRLRYMNPQDLLFAFLTKLQRRIPDQSSEVARTVSALLSLLLIDKQNKQFAPVSKNVEILAILGYLDNPEFGPKVNQIYDKAINALVSKPELQIAMSKLIPSDKGKCIAVDGCLKEILQKVDQLNIEIPRQMEIIINELNSILPLQTTNPVCRSSSSLLITKAVENYPSNEDKSFENNDIDDSNLNHQVNINSGHRIKIEHIYAENPKHKHIIKANPTWVTNVILMPPMLKPTQDLTIYITKNGIPVVDSPNIPSYSGNAKVTLPSVEIILKPPTIEDPFSGMNPEFKRDVLQPTLKLVDNNLPLILGSSVRNLIISGKCPTTGAIVLLLLNNAKTNPKVRTDEHLLKTINKYLSSFDLIAVMTLPTILRVKKIYPIEGVLYSIINIAKPYNSILSVTPPINYPEGTNVFPIVDPNKLREPVDPENPYEGLLPNVAPNTPGREYVQQLKGLFTQTKIAQLIPNIKPESYTSKGFLLIIILQKLPKTSAIKANLHLKKIISGYIWAIIIPAFYTKLPYEELRGILDQQPEVLPDTTSLWLLLPHPKNEREKHMFNKIKMLLKRQDLFDMLLIPKPAPNTSQNDLLKIIINAVLSSRDKFDKLTLHACKYYSSMIFDKEKGFSPIIWKLKEITVTHAQVNLGQMIDNVIDYTKLSDENKSAFNDLVDYFKENSNIFDQIQDFTFTQFNTEGEFIKGLFTFLLNKPIISEIAKNNIKALLPHVMLYGPGAQPIEQIQEASPKSGRRSASQLEINI